MAKLNPALFAQYFPAPKVSRFNRSRQIEATIKIGKLYPMNWELLSFGDSMKASTMHKMRFMPMMAPNYSNMWMQQQAAVIPLRAVMNNYETVFNYAKNRDGASLPVITFFQLKNIYKQMAEKGVSIIGSLFDFLGYPVYADLYKSLTKAMPFSSSENIFQGWQGFTSDGPAIDVPYGTQIGWDYVPSPVFLKMFTTGGGNPEFQSFNKPGGLYLTVEVRGKVIYFDDHFYSIPTFWLWLIQLALELDNPVTIGDVSVGTSFKWNFFTLDDQNQNINITSKVRHLFDTMQSDQYASGASALANKAGFNTLIVATEAYMNYLHNKLINVYFDEDGVTEAEPFTALPLLAYHRFVADWMLNSNFTDPDEYLGQYVFNLLGAIETATELNSDGFTKDELINYFTPTDRLWDYDYFTSLLPSATTENNITIPANATVLDLAKLTAFQKVVLRLSYSSRYRDVVWNLFKIRPSDARLNQSSVLAEWSSRIGIGEDIQVSQTTESSVLGSFGGKAYGSGGSKNIHIMAEEPCVVLHLASIVPEASYMDAPDTLIHVNDIWDLPIPETDVLGNQPVYAYELTGYPQDNHVLGFGRQYYQWLANFSTCRGDMRTSLDYWHLARRFEDGAALNSEFLSVSDKDDLDRIFSLGDTTQVALSYYINNNVTRPVHRSVRVLV